MIGLVTMFNFVQCLMKSSIRTAIPIEKKKLCKQIQTGRKNKLTLLSSSVWVVGRLKLAFPADGLGALGCVVDELCIHAMHISINLFLGFRMNEAKSLFKDSKKSKEI